MSKRSLEVTANAVCSSYFASLFLYTFNLSLLLCVRSVHSSRCSCIINKRKTAKPYSTNQYKPTQADSEKKIIKITGTRFFFISRIFWLIVIPNSYTWHYTFHGIFSILQKKKLYKCDDKFCIRKIDLYVIFYISLLTFVTNNEITAIVENLVAHKLLSSRMYILKNIAE